jgi:hypothetical protein
MGPFESGRERRGGRRIPPAILGALSVLAVIRCLGQQLLPPVTPEPDGAVRWTSSASVAGVATAPRERLLATRGALVTMDDAGRSTARLWEPEAEWRGVSANAAVGVRHRALRKGAGWQVSALPEGVEGYSVAEGGGVVWIGHSAGATAYDPQAVPVRSLSQCGPVRTLAADGEGAWLLGDRRWARVKRDPGEVEWLSPPEGASSPWKCCIRGGELFLAGTGADARPRVYRLARSRQGSQWVALPEVPTTGVAAGALAAPDGGLLLAVPHDGLWQWNGRAWSRLPAPADAAQDISSLSASTGVLLAGTWAHGAWERQGGRWTRLETGGELPVSDLQGMAEWGGKLWTASFDQGLWSLDRGRWRRWGKADGLSSEAPRSLVALPDGLLVRHAGGEVDRWDGRAWTRDALKWRVPRAWAASLSPEGRAGGWGSVARPTTAGWQQEILPEPLRKETVTGAGAMGDSLLVGTAKNGAWRVTGGTATPLPGPVDAWITALQASDAGVVAGTFAGEAVYWSPRSASGDRQGTPLGEPVTAKLPSPVMAVCLAEGRPPLAACRSGVWRLASGRWERMEEKCLAGLEPQCLCPGRKGVWVGGRNGAAFVPWTP